MIAQHRDSIEGAYSGAFTAKAAFVFCHDGYPYANRLAARNLRFEKNMVVRFLDVAIDKRDLIVIFQGKGEAGGHQCLARPALTAGN
jgi:hypothetical protein